VKVSVHIERLILEGLPVSRIQGGQVQASLKRELGRLLATRGLAHELRGGMALPSVSAAGIEFPPESHPAGLGRQVARVVHGAIGEHKRR
jgi:hypothetical protein